MKRDIWSVALATLLGLALTLALIYLVLFAAAFPARGATESPLPPDCRALLHDSYLRQVSKGDIALSIKEVLNGAAQIDYINKQTGIYTQYFLISDSKNLVNRPGVVVYGPCIINPPGGIATPATMFVVQWFTRPFELVRGDWVNGRYGAWVHQVHRTANTIRN
jgi:hypothetical protein